MEVSVSTGRYVLSPETGRLFIHTTRSGPGAMAGHDLTIEATRWRGLAVADLEDPAKCSVNVEVEVDSLEVREGTGGLKQLTDSDRAEIKRNICDKVLKSVRYPKIIFESRRFEGTPESFRCEGDLTITDVRRPVVLDCRVVDGWVQGTTTVKQSRWGIRPFSAFFGALRLDDDIQVRFDVGLTVRV
ncbi:YceI family protein [Thermobispora bispora]|uniref:YceI family protein n=1 Tax=Thermobispora bispora (strain ATCC 19993 / DSM 43833 / CBS 139.67 / JCM 10125 / KCTC 9307 / NBRC 14880 / R51) TaxID=469371 RepID=D6YAY2_THEBD|nr:YceI family protein [Thermobispora bispora]ADG88349.1 YceI family protein [Thermobispora bispora DSM 43833]MBO2474953.1 YceI family protein [Actinomycetales bacterium]MBX6169096.1 YceI family protein [Thermobispora bispora]